MTAPARSVSPRLRELLDAAVTVVAASGLRGLTHRAVDAAAGLPQGTCSAYLRTRLALLTALAQHVAARLEADIAALSRRIADHAGDHDYAADQTTALFAAWLRDRDLLLCRLEMAVAAAHITEVADVFTAWRQRLVDLVADTLMTGDEEFCRARAETLVAALDGVLMSAVVRPPRGRRAYLLRNVSTLIATLGQPTEGRLPEQNGRRRGRGDPLLDGPR
ncbi:MAG TPA: hypothetical protein VFM07_03720 [Intrasporangium sp.]|nr:hypothetical protein [Intrasporangium sp.]